MLSLAYAARFVYIATPTIAATTFRRQHTSQPPARCGWPSAEVTAYATNSDVAATSIRLATKASRCHCCLIRQATPLTSQATPPAVVFTYSHQNVHFRLSLPSESHRHPPPSTTSGIDISLHEP